MNTIQLLVVDDNPLFRRGLIALLLQDWRFAIAGQAGDMGEALRRCFWTSKNFNRMRPRMPPKSGYKMHSGSQSPT